MLFRSGPDTTATTATTASQNSDEINASNDNENSPEHSSGSCILSPSPSSDSSLPIYPRPDFGTENSDTAVTLHRETRPHHHPQHQHPMRLRKRNPILYNYDQYLSDTE